MSEPNTDTQMIYNKEQAVSVNSYFDAKIGDEGVRLQVTTRNGADVARIVSVVMNHIEAYSKLRETYPYPAYQDIIPAGVPQQVVVGEKKAFEQKPVPDAEKPPELPEGLEVFKDDFDRFVIEPKPDMKATVKFYKDGLTWPVGAQINNWKNETVMQYLSPLGEFDPAKATEKRVSGVMYWSRGNEYIIQKGAHKGEKSHYKDLRLIQANL